MNKRCFNTAESIIYLGCKRRSFEENIMPHLAGKGTQIGNCKVYERSDLDAAWEAYKIEVGSLATKGDSKWDAPKRPASTRQTMATKLTNTIGASVFDNVASLVLRTRKPG